MQSKHLALFFTLIFLILSLTACLSLAEDITPPPGYQAPTAPQSTATSPAPVYPILPPDPTRGEANYAEKCAPCHGNSGLGDGPDASELPNPVAPLGDPDFAREAAPADWYLMVSNGNLQKFMPPFNSLTVPERWDVIAYAYTLSTTPEEVARGQELFAENCAACHGERGEGDGPEAGSLSVSPINFTDQEFMGTRSAADLFVSITNGLGEMHSFADLTEDDRWALTSFLRTLTFDDGTVELVEEGDIPETQAGEASPETSATPEEVASDIPSEGEAESTLGTVTVEMVAASGNPLPSGMEVTVFVFEDMAQVYSTTLALSDTGIAEAVDVPMKPEQFVFATTNHEGVVYGSDIVVVESGMTSVDVSVPYYEPTTDVSVLKAERMHIFFDFVSEDTIQVFVLYIFSNTSDMVLAAESNDAPALVFTLPEGATNLERDIGMEIQDVDLPDGFGLLTVYPSTEQYQILYSFELPYDQNSAEIDLPIAIDTSAVIVMMPENGVEVESNQLTDAGMRDIEGISYNLYNGSNLRSGDQLGMAVSGKPKASAVAGDTATGVGTSNGLVIGLASFGVVLIGAGVYLWVRNRDKEEAGDGSEDAYANDLPETENPEDLMDAIITLDDLYQKGEIPEDAYLERRAELKAHLKEIMGSEG
jgi:mono/diheme cytochrome c family protein